MHRILLASAVTLAVASAGLVSAQAVGSGWRVDDAPISRNLRTYADLAPAARSADVWAVGNELLDSGTAVSEDALVERWSGGSWNVVDPPALPGASTVGLTQVSIAAHVWTIGSAGYAKGVRHDFASYLDGNRWQTHRFGVGFVADQLHTVSSTDVWVLGTQHGRGEGAHWDGRRWSVVALPAVPSRTLTHVAAPAWAPAVGRGHGTVRLMHLDGRSWTVVRAPVIARPSNAGAPYIADVVDAGQGHVTLVAGFRGGTGSAHAAAPQLAVYAQSASGWTRTVVVKGFAPGDLTSDGRSGVWVLGLPATGADELVHVVGRTVAARVRAPSYASTLTFDALARAAGGVTIYAGGFASLARYVP